MDGVHEALALGVDDHGALAAQRLGDEEARRALFEEHRRVKLRVLQIDHARADAVGHRHTVADAARLVRRVLEKLPEAAGREDGFFGDDGADLLRLGVEHVGAKTRQGLVFVGRIVRAMREREQVDGHPAQAARDARRGVDARSHAGEDRVPGGVLRMDDAALVVPTLAGKLEPAVLRAVEGDAERVDQQLLHGNRALLHEVGDGGRVGQLVARIHDVARKQLRVGVDAVDDAALGPVAVGGERAVQGEQLHVESALRGLQRVRAAGEAGANHKAIGTDDVHWKKG